LREASFSWRTREGLLEGLEAQYDIIIIGGGIVGCGICWEAARSGYRVLLLEKGDIGSGTSSRSSRLIHGGLRYLKYGRLRLVRQAARERERLRRMYPYLVRPLPFLIPFYEGEGEGPLLTLFGLWLYDTLAGVMKADRHRKLSREDVMKEEPSLRPEGLRGGAIYYDCITNDFRLVLLNARMAHRAGAHILTYVAVDSLIMEDGRVVGVRFRDVLGGRSGEARARLVINAAGPWGDGIRLMLPDGRRRLRPTKGVHILLPRGRIGNRNAVVMRSPRDDRIVFALPWHEYTIVGTTDTDYAGDPDAVGTDIEDVEYLLEATNRTFPQAHVTREDVVSSFAALRPLLGRHGVPESEVTRDYKVIVETPGLLSIIGGKLTTYRRMAERVIALASRYLPGPAPAFRPLGKGPTAAVEDGELEEIRESLLRRAADLGLDTKVVEHLLSSHGPESKQLLDYVSSEGIRRIVPDLPYLVAEVSHAVDHEMALRLEDMLVRRTGIIYEDPSHGLGAAEKVASLMGEMMEWDQKRLRRELEEYKEIVASIKASREDG
jgi:glycerol-3-phosphate dehydrogenase